MTVIADITIPAESFELGEVLNEYPDVTIELERIVPLTDAIIPLFWISDNAGEAIETTLRDHPRTEAVTKLTDTDDSSLFEVRWGPDINGVVQALIETNARVLEAAHGRGVGFSPPICDSRGLNRVQSSRHRLRGSPHVAPDVQSNDP